MGTFLVVSAVIGGFSGAVISGLYWEAWEESRRCQDPPTIVLVAAVVALSTIAGSTFLVWSPLAAVVGVLIGVGHGVRRLKKWVVSKGKITVTIGRDVSDE